MNRLGLIFVASTALLGAIFSSFVFMQNDVYADASIDMCNSNYATPAGETDPARIYAYETAASSCKNGVAFQRQGISKTECLSGGISNPQNGVNPDALKRVCESAYDYSANNPNTGPPRPPAHPCLGLYTLDADGGTKRQDACKQGFAYAEGDYSQECGDMDANPLDFYTKICIEGYNLNPNKKTPYPTKSYRKDLQNAAPKDYVLPGANEEIRGSRNAQVFCNYYKTPEETRFDTENIYKSCLIGYEVGFGSDKICTERYLLGSSQPGYPYTNATSRQLAEQWTQLNLRSSYNIDDYKRALVAACRDGWTQYKVDYWYCNKNEACINALRTEPKRIVDPGPMPTRSVDASQNSSVPLPGAVTANTADTTMSCGGVRTVYFSCGGGAGIENSSFWQILQIILNVMIALVSIVAVGGIIYGAIRYSSAGDSETAVNEAKTIIKNVIIGLVLFISMWAIIQYFIPGGLF